ncbi:Hsp20 family protein [Roseibium sp. RKSG952]|uniref:Hsp20 family protein n=1 Tax=Roseibium sp. RKSG952 TaxID=2529384 RepID=UPI0012BBFB9D|nr:Hsp20 family protein [Roseibium sp. RKSG952]MTH94974.1 Hsp20 family protein [Roseibium sp. RKSG952]
MNNRFLDSLIGHTIGFDNLLNAAQDLASPTFPPHNLERIGENVFLLTMAVAGYRHEDLTIDLEDRVLVISGKPTDDGKEEKSFLYKGISSRSFRKAFQLGSEVHVEGASLADGLLKVELKRIVPDEKKPRKIDIAA